MTDTGDATAPCQDAGPKRPPSNTEEADEAPGQLDQEPVDVEENTPAGERTSVEDVPPEDDETPPVFEE